MTKLESVTIRRNLKGLRGWIDELTTFWNAGKYSFNTINAEPSSGDKPSDAEIRVFDNGSVVRLYVYAPTTGAWFKTGDLTQV